MFLFSHTEQLNLMFIGSSFLLQVSSSFSCLRRAVLDERLKSTEQSISALIGTMLHQIFQVSPFFHSHIFPNPDYSTFVNLDVILNSDLIFKTVIVYHWYYQAGLLKDSPTRMFLEEYAASVLQKNVENLYACDGRLCLLIFHNKMPPKSFCFLL